jgi:TolB-like protein/class 3 adenylate cyclase
LAAILAADVAGYSRLMGADEIETLRGLQGHVRELIRPTIAEHHGRIVKTTGDGILAEFASAVDSVACSIAVQRGMASRNADRPADRRIEFRIGINLGDLIVDDDDIYGDGVNVAARLETLAEPGGICISAAVRDQVRDKLDVDLADIGEQTLKNIARPVHVFRVAIDRTQSAALVRSSLPLPDKPSIAVLPFINLSGDPNQEYFADGVVEDIITGLARIKWVFVIARNSSFTYKGRAIDVKQVSRELGVRYVLEGSVRKASDRVRITAQLIDATSGTHIWADHYDRSIEDIFAVQDELTINVLGVIEPTLRQAEIERAKRKRPESLDAYDLYLRALPYAFTAMPQDADKALALLQRAIELEPDYAAAHAIMAWCHEQRYLRAGLHEEAKIAALRNARKAIAMGGDDAAALAMAGFVVAVIEYDYASATAAFDRSFALSNSSALALGFSSIVRAWKGDDDAAVEQAQRSIRLSPFDPLLYLPYIGLTYAHFSAGRFEEAAEAAGLASQSNPMFSIPYALHAAALANLGRSVEARSMVERLREIEPDITVASAIESARYANRGKNAELGDALRRAGLPE